MYNPAAGGGSGEAGTFLSHVGAALPFVRWCFLGELCPGCSGISPMAPGGLGWVPGGRECASSPGTHQHRCWTSQARGVLWWLSC